MTLLKEEQIKFALQEKKFTLMILVAKKKVK